MKYVVIAIAIVALAASGSLLPKVNASSCPPAPNPTIQICFPPPPFKLPVGSWEATIGALPAILNITSVSSAGKVNGSIVGGDVCKGNVVCTIDGTIDLNSGKISFINTAIVHEGHIKFFRGSQNFTGQASRVLLLDFKTWQLAGTGTNVKGLSNETQHEFAWDAHKGQILG